MTQIPAMKPQAAPLRFEACDPQGPQALALLHEASLEARALYPELFAPDAPLAGNGPLAARSVYLLAWQGEHCVACGAIQPLPDPAQGEPAATDTAEVRRMYVLKSARRGGLARALLDQLEAQARRLGYRGLRLETGYRQHAAMALYEAAGYQHIAAFGPYVGDPTSVCFEKLLT
jgi:putative acetyltransferase